MSMFSLRPLRLSAAAAALAVIGPFAATAEAQSDKVYAISDVQAPPKLSSTATAARLIQDSYPADLKNRGVGGMVELQFVVDDKGKVDPGTVEVVDATQTALGEAAKKVVARLDFNPAKVNGTPVRVKVTLPIIYKP
jgi:protein TonB